FGFGGISSLGSYLSYFSLSITSILFLAPMLVEMIYFIFFRMKPGFEKRSVVTILIMQLADPAMLGKSSLVVPLLAAYSLLMIAAIYYLFSYVYAHRDEITMSSRKIVRWIIVLIVISAAGLLEPVLYPHPFGLSWLIFAISMMMAMTLYFTII
ncbi:ferredoxin, partial [mine drainage metagenome]